MSCQIKTTIDIDSRSVLKLSICYVNDNALV